MTQITQKTQAMGNTKPSLIRARRWCGTWNNYTDEDYTQITQDFTKLEYKFTIGKEISKSNTPHLQIYFESKNALTFNSLKKRYPKVHWEKARGNSKQNFEYCSKDGNYESNQESFKIRLNNILLTEYEEVEWKPWQLKIIELVKTKPNDRDINWIWETNGNVGKSFLCKYLVLKFNCIIADGKKNDVFNQVNMMLDKGIEPNIIILDIPRYSKEFTNYGLLEQLKNGMIYSGKYEGGVCLFHSPHVLVFSNDEPNIKMMSIDRWKIHAI